MFRSLKGETFHLKKFTPSTDTEAIAEGMSTAQILRRATQAKTKSKTKIFLSHVNKPLQGKFTCDKEKLDYQTCHLKDWLETVKAKRLLLVETTDSEVDKLMDDEFQV